MKFLIFGLGNIGEEYSNTRHNIGFIIADALTVNLKGLFASDRYASVSRLRYKGRQIIAVKPTTYMNLSGKAVKYWMTKENVPIENIIVVVDDIALPIGTLRLKSKGSDGGHNGLIDIIEKLGSIEFPRLRIGIGNDYPKGSQVNYVLGQWTKEESLVIKTKTDKAVEMIKCFSCEGINNAMNKFNE